MTRGEKKFILWFGVTLVLWRVVHSPSVQDAFLQFLAIGQIPLTNTMLSPDAVFMVLAGVFSGSLLLIFHKEIAASAKGRRRHHSGQIETAQMLTPDIVESSATDISAIIIRGSRHEGTAIPAPKLSLRDKKLPMLYIPSARPYVRRAGVMLRKAAIAEYDSLRTIFVFIWRVIVITVAYMWRFTKPRIYQIDKWLDRKLHQNALASEILEIIGECWRSVMVSRRKSEKS